MLSTIPKLADRAFIVGFLLPTVLFITLGLALFGDLGQVEKLLEDPKGDRSASAGGGGRLAACRPAVDSQSWHVSLP